MSWVIRMIAVPSVSRSSRIRSRICAWIVTSSAVVGSSAISTFGIARQRHGDHHALAHAAGQLVRIGVRAALRFRDVHAAQHVDGTVHGVAARQSLMQRDRLADLPAHREQRIERGHRLLEDHRDVVAADVLHLALGQVEQIGALEADGAVDDAPGRVGDEPQDGQRGDALAAAGLADHAQRLAAAQAVGNAIDRPHDAGGREEMRVEIVDLQQRTGWMSHVGDGCPARRRLHFTQDVTPKIPACYLWRNGPVQRAIRARRPQS